MFTQKFIKVFHSVQEIGLVSLFKELALGKASTNDNCHFAISWTRCRQYQCVCKILSKYSKRFRVIDIFHEQSGDKIFTNCPVTTFCTLTVFSLLCKKFFFFFFFFFENVEKKVYSRGFLVRVGRVTVNTTSFIFSP